MEYFIVSTATLCVATYLIYVLANKIFHIHLRLKSLILCACCALFIGNILPRFVIGFAGLTGTIGVLIICAILFSYFIAYHNECEERERNKASSSKSIHEQDCSEEETTKQIGLQLNVQETRLSEYYVNNSSVEDHHEKWPEVISEADERLESEMRESAVTLENGLDNEAESEELLKSVEPENEEIVVATLEIPVDIRENSLETTVLEPAQEPNPEESAVAINDDSAFIELEDVEIEQEAEIQPKVDEISENETESEELLTSVEQENEEIIANPESNEEVEAELKSPLEIPVDTREDSLEITELEPAQESKPEESVVVINDDSAFTELEDVEIEQEAETQLKVDENSENEMESEELLKSVEPENEEIVVDTESNEEVEAELKSILEAPVDIKEDSLETTELEPVQEPNPEASPVVIEDDLASLKPEDVEKEQEAEIQQKADEPSDNESVLEEIDFCSSLDELLDYAFTKKDELQLPLALKAFNKALSLCKDTDLAPMVIVEMSNIFKTQGQYDQAVQLFSAGRNLPYVLENNILNQQFIEMIAFLRIIKNNLLEHQIGFVPYDKIPSDLMYKINEEFHDWLTLSCAKPQTRRISEE